MARLISIDHLTDESYPDTCCVLFLFVVVNYCTFLCFCVLVTFFMARSSVGRKVARVTAETTDLALSTS